MKAIRPKLYQYNVCPFCWKVKAILAYKQVSYESVEVHPLNKKEIKFSNDYRKVPIFIDAGGNQVKYSGAVVMTLVAKKSAKSQGIKDPEAHLKKCLGLWAEALGGKAFLGGKKPNGADLAAFGILRSIEGLPAFKFVEENKKVREWY